MAAYDVWPAQLNGSGPDDVIVGFNGNPGLHVLDSNTYFAAAKPWLAIGRQGGEVDVIDASSGAMIGTIDGQGFDPESAWIESKDGSDPLLAISTHAELSAFKAGP